ncbi:hypothetical protein KC343_g4725 [Hortaea werneckii]|nr:hypothetical protein KC352_g10600 [Hortaea werneckii]KAI7568263.1 hypothetical protein KC317_g4357 [Hortaea werneckii]KAI7620680.1 hypothetical protein KC346_g3985 [Hortaea werneckii]KAI7630277.1 hypothetical protein KC343_g4725 [Hortaea werneckii]KAI7677709.1 hypothetical protein KC319_g3747 [Hortaea werneckii]
MLPPVAPVLKPSAESKVHISIVVHKGEPLDYPQYRHSALFVRFRNDESLPYLAHIVGSPRDHAFETEDSGVPTDIPSFARLISVGWLSPSWTPSMLRQLFPAIPINNRDMEFNCQTWVERTLKVLRDSGALTPAQYDKGVNEMVDAIAEAEDEES